MNDAEPAATVLTSIPVTIAFLVMALLAALFFLGMLTLKKGWWTQTCFPCEPRRQVPWNLLDVLAVFVFYFMLGTAALQTLAPYIPSVFPVSVVGEDKKTAIASEESDNLSKELDNPKEPKEESRKLEKAHPLTVLMTEGKRQPMILVICFLMAVVAAPLGEEFLFRVILQGAFESLENSTRRVVLLLRRMPRGFFSVFITALVFAAIHWREPKSEGSWNLNLLLTGMIAQTIANFGIVLFGVGYLTFFRGATWADFGFHNGFRNLRSAQDVLGAFYVYLILMIPMMMIQGTLGTLFPDTVTDPAPLLVFSLALGILYYRTRRLLTCLTLHMSMNAVSFFLMLLWYS